MNGINSPKNADGGVNLTEGRLGQGEEKVGVVCEGHEEGDHQSLDSDKIGICSNHLVFPKDGTAWIALQPSSNYQGILQRCAWSWYEDTGLPANVTVRIGDRNFELHKFPLVSRSGYFRRELVERNEICLPETFPGGGETFELVAAYCYGETVVMDSSNIASLRCAADFCEMTEDYCRGNLCKRSEHYFNQVILKSWKDAIEVLRNCKSLHPLADEMLIVSSCVEAVSVMATAHSFDERQEKAPANDGNSVEGSEDWWIHDLLTLPFDYFGQIIACIRRQGMQEKFIGRAILFYVDRWIFDMLNARENLEEKSLESEEIQTFSRDERRGVVESIVSFLPGGKDVMPVSFMFAILRCALAWNASLECRVQLETKIAAQLEQATLMDFLLPLRTDEQQLYASRLEIDSMQQIVSQFYSQRTVDVGNKNSSDNLFGELENCSISETCTNSCVRTVSKVWDEYLTEIAFDPRISPSVFLDLIGTVPAFGRPSHDQLYKAIHTYLKTHPHISDEERLNICKALNCHKLSKEICIHAVQNDLMPLRMIVQAMFMHQLKARQAVEPAENYPSRRNNGTIKTEKSGKKKLPAKFGNEMDGRNEGSSLSLGYILKRDAAFRQRNYLKADFEETCFRLKILEAEMARMRTSLRKTDYPDDDHLHNNNNKQKFSSEMRHSKKVVRSSSKGCGSGVAHKFVKSFHKLSLRKGVEDVAGDVVDDQMYELELEKARRHRRNRSTSESALVSCSAAAHDQSKGVGMDSSDSKKVRRRHRRNNSVS